MGYNDYGQYPEDEEKLVRRRRLYIWAAVSLFVVVALVAVFFLASKWGKPTAETTRETPEEYAKRKERECFAMQAELWQRGRRQVCYSSERDEWVWR